ncbi:MAG: hypothetical protein AVO39_06895 [delta proteobacterium MLS_D]|jgi:uncharacterized protein|nr:MAG: hypothetical protein AVO39_06895 [delta proteobacterium MLS_D]
MSKPMKYIGIGLALLLVISALFDTIIEAFVNFYFFDSLNFSSVFWTYFTTEYIIQILFFLVFLGFGGINLYIAYRSTQQRITIIDMGQVSLPVRALQWGLFLLLAFMAWAISSYPASNWLEVLMYLNRSPFGQSDPVFGRDISFYFFSLPVFEMLRNYTTAVLFVTVIVTTGAYVIARGVIFTPQNVTVSPAVKMHGIFFLAVFFTIQLFTYWLARYELLFSADGVVYGMNYVDEKIRVPVYNGLIVVCFAGIVLAALGMIKRSLKQPLAGLGVLIVSIIIFSGLLPSFVQRFSVDPNELQRERPYLDNHIQSTRSAYGLDEIEEKPYPVDYSLTREDLKNNRLTIENIPLWDSRPLLETYTQIQAIRPYYDFNDIDIARYNLDGDYRQIMLAPRELDQKRLSPDSQTWVNKTFIYTHGYGLVASPVNVFTEEGLPELFIRDIPPRKTVDLDLDRPEIYFGERTNEPVVVRSGTEEFDYPYGERNVFTMYQEKTGVAVGSLFRRLIFSINFGTINYLITDYILPDSQLLYYRNIHERVSLLAPFLSFDHDPYITIVDGRLYWIYDAYTTSSRYPYSRPYAQNVNYIRNSVKVVIDAYNGTTHFYTIGEKKDPLIRAYADVFPDLFLPIEEMPEGLRAQIRYPQDLFDVQSSMFRIYHMSDPVMFYNREDVWELPKERVFGSAQTMESYYTILRFPEKKREEFILLMPFTPSNRDNMIAWLSGRSDGDNYGSLLLFRFPRGELVFGPMQIEARIDQTAEIAQQLALWDQAGTRVLRGSQLVIPIENSVLYIKPLFLRAVEGRLPELRRVLASDGTRVVMEAGLDQALDRLFGETIPLEAMPAVEAVLPDSSMRPGTTAPLQTLQEHARRALDRYESAQRSIREGNWSKYGEEIEKLRKDLQKLIDAGAVRPLDAD